MREHEGDDEDQRHAQQPENDWHQSLHCIVVDPEGSITITAVVELGSNCVQLGLGARALERMVGTNFITGKF
jgi:hypothetical protein